MFRKIQYLIIAGFLLFAAAGLFAQTLQELRSGSSFSATLGRGEEQWYSIRVTEECFVVVETSGNTDTYLEIYDASNNLITLNDDGGEDVNARVEFYSASGRAYRVKLVGFNSSESGPYRIMASQKPIRPTELRVGASITGNIVGDVDYWYRVTPSGTGFLVVETSGYIDTYLEAYDSSYNFIAANDDGGDDFNARLELLVDTGKTYLVRLICYNSDDSGPYRIWASFENIPADERNTEYSRAVALKLGEPNFVYFRTPSESRWFRYESPRSGNTLVVQTRGNMDTVMYLYDFNGSPIAYDDDSGEGYNAMIFERLGTGTFYIEVREYSGGTGYCTLHAEIR